MKTNTNVKRKRATPMSDHEKKRSKDKETLHP